MEFWELKVKKELQELINKNRKIIMDFNLEKQRIVYRQSYMTYKDWGYLINKYGDKKYLEAMIEKYNKRLELLTNGYFKSEKQYYSCAIF